MIFCGSFQKKILFIFTIYLANVLSEDVKPAKAADNKIQSTSNILAASSDKDISSMSDEKYLHSWENGRRPPLSTLKMVCKDLSDLKGGDYVFITVQGKDEVYELAGTDFGKEGSVYKVERINDTFAFKHPSTTGFLFFNSPSYYVGVKKDSDVLDMFQTFDNKETSFKLLYHEKLNGFVMKSTANEKCLTVCEKLFGHSPCFRKDQCAAVRIYKIPAYCLQKNKPTGAKANDKGSKREQLEKIKQKEALVNTAIAAGRGQSTAISPADTSSKAIPSVCAPVKEVRVSKRVVVHRRVPKSKRKVILTVDTSVLVVPSKQSPVTSRLVPSLGKEIATSICKYFHSSASVSSTTTTTKSSCSVTLSAEATPTTSKASCFCGKIPCSCGLTVYTSIPVYQTSTATVKVFVTSKPIIRYDTSILVTTVASTKLVTQSVPVSVYKTKTHTSKTRVTSTDKVSVTSTNTVSFMVTSCISTLTPVTKLPIIIQTVQPASTPVFVAAETTAIVKDKPQKESAVGVVKSICEAVATAPPMLTLTSFTTETVDIYI